MKSYKVINAPHLRTLESLVSINMQDGWTPTGGVSANKSSPTRDYIKEWCQTSNKLIDASTEPVISETLWTQAVVLLG